MSLVKKLFLIGLLFITNCGFTLDGIGVSGMSTVGVGVGTTTPPVLCLANGSACTINSQCCNASCDSLLCQVIIPPGDPDPPVSGGRLMPLGDSITVGSGGVPKGQRVGWRYKLQDKFGVHFYNFVGPADMREPYSSDFIHDQDQAGVGGEWTTHILARVNSNLLSSMPKPNPPSSAVLLMIGTNDIRSGANEATTVNNVITIINNINTYDSTIAVYVALIIPPSEDATWDSLFTSYNTALNTALETRQLTKANLHIVDQNKNFRDHCSPLTSCFPFLAAPAPAHFDPLHPNPAGYQLMANAWYDCIWNYNRTYCDGN